MMITTKEQLMQKINEQCMAADAYPVGFWAEKNNTVEIKYFIPNKDKIIVIQDVSLNLAESELKNAIGNFEAAKQKCEEMLKSKISHVYYWKT